MNDHIVQELTDYLDRAKKGEVTDYAFICATTDGELHASFLIESFHVIGALEYVKSRALSTVTSAATRVLESRYEENNPDRQNQTEDDETIQEDDEFELREARSKTGQKDGPH
jgi:Holliday junction resolvasome RuvABC ATP-dependent DNA helicase subunit